MKLKKILAGVLSFGVPFSVLIITHTLLSPTLQETEWLATLAAIVSLLFMIEVVKPLRGEQRAWVTLKPLDKIILGICLSIQLIACLYPLSKGMPFVALTITLASYGLTWITINKFGSDELKETLLWPKL